MQRGSGLFMDILFGLGKSCSESIGARSRRGGVSLTRRRNPLCSPCSCDRPCCYARPQPVVLRSRILCCERQYHTSRAKKYCVIEGKVPLGIDRVLREAPSTYQRRVSCRRWSRAVRMCVGFRTCYICLVLPSGGVGVDRHDLEPHLHAGDVGGAAGLDPRYCR